MRSRSRRSGRTGRASCSWESRNQLSAPSAGCGIAASANRRLTRTYFFFSSRRRLTRLTCDWSSDVCYSDLRPDWFQIRRSIVRVPRVDEVGENKFEVKDSESREIPLSPQFLDFLREFLQTVEKGSY